MSVNAPAAPVPPAASPPVSDFLGWRTDLVCHCRRQRFEPCWDHRHEIVLPGVELGDIRCEPHGHHPPYRYAPPAQGATR